jgi:membrane protease YdiL (CAAX protease family)
MTFAIIINLLAVILAAIFLQKKYTTISKHRVPAVIDGLAYGIAANALSHVLIGIGLGIFGGHLHSGQVLTNADSIITFTMATIFAPYWEELLFRGWLLDKITKHTNFTFSAIFTTVLFPLLHIKEPQIFLSLLALSIGCLIVRIRHKSVTPAIICHSIFNAASLSIFI